MTTRERIDSIRECLNCVQSFEWDSGHDDLEWLCDELEKMRLENIILRGELESARQQIMRLEK